MICNFENGISSESLFYKGHLYSGSSVAPAVPSCFWGWYGLHWITKAGGSRASLINSIHVAHSRTLPSVWDGDTNSMVKLFWKNGSGKRSHREGGWTFQPRTSVMRAKLLFSIRVHFIRSATAPHLRLLAFGIYIIFRYTASQHSEWIHGRWAPP